ncbi:hypothetical protein ACP3W1_28905, partial [Salmonella enterica]|uniref:hypothetical protein n=1 Tax=Salmonella enterica TaxID=28901 RepID=UPI003CEED265
DKLEAKAVRAIKEFLDDCIRSGAFLSSGDNIKDCIGNYVKSKINAASLGFYKFQFDVKLNADIVNGDMGQGPR